MSAADQEVLSEVAQTLLAELEAEQEVTTEADSMEGLNRTGREVVVVAGAMLVLVVLVLSLLALGATPCLRCWPDAVLYVPYDVRLLLGVAQSRGAAGLEKELSALFLGGARDRRIRVMERESLEREAGKLFYHLDQIITRNRHDPGRLMKEAQLEKQNFTNRLRAASAAILRKVCDTTCGQPQPFDLAKCSNCQHLQARCRDRQICSGASVILAVVLSLGLVLGAGAAMGRQAHGPEAKEGPTTGETEPPMDPRDKTPSDQEDWPPPSADQGDGPPPLMDEVNRPLVDPGDWPPPPADLGDWPPPPADQGDGPPPLMDEVKRPLVDPGDWPPPPADLGDWPPPPADPGDWLSSPTDQVNRPPVDQENWPPPPDDQEYRAPTEGQPLALRQ